MHACLVCQIKTCPALLCRNRLRLNAVDGRVVEMEMLIFGSRQVRAISPQ